MKTASGLVTLGRIGIVQGSSQKIVWHPLAPMAGCGGTTTGRAECPFHDPIALLQAVRHGAAARDGRAKGGRS